MQNKNQCLGRVVEGLFLSNAGPKRGCLSYLTRIRVIHHKSDICFLIIAIRYDKHPLLGPALDKNETFNYTTQTLDFFFAQQSVDFFFQHHISINAFLSFFRQLHVSLARVVSCTV